MAKYIFFFVLIIFSFIEDCFSQEGEFIKNRTIYINIDENQDLEFQLFGDDETEFSINDINEFILKNKLTNLYIEWSNPLQHSISISDTTYSDGDDENIKLFLNALLGKFGIGLNNLSELNQSDLGFLSVNTPVSTMDANGDVGFTLVISNIALPSLKSKILIDLLFDISSVSDQFSSADDLDLIKKLFSKLITSDSLAQVSFIQEIQEDLKRLYDAKTVDEAKVAIDSINKLNSKFEGHLNTIKQDLDKLNDTIKEMDEISIPILVNFIPIQINSFIESVKKDTLLQSQMISDLKKLSKYVEASYEDIKTKGDKNYLKLDKSIKLDRGYNYQLNIDIVENAIEDGKISLKSTDNKKAHRLNFRRKKIIKPSVGLGSYYALGVSLERFGLTTNESDQLIVTMDSIESEGLSTALFLNLEFLPDSDFHPMLQLGVDPLKDRSNILLGIGFTLPVANGRFSFSIGTFFNTNEELKDLNVGDAVKSTTEFEEGVKNAIGLFDQGFIGLQYRL
ncbi:MAG: hypothetical protein HKN09_05265 [Saprospiraceae bacterium]|nr:hypothetical protein [Saprospiraceae bacterium]